MRKLLIALVVFPLAAFAQAGQPGAGKQQNAPPTPPQQQQGPGMQRGPGGQGRGQGWQDPKRMERRIRLFRTLGLAEALDLEPADALKLGDQLAKNDDKRIALHQQMRDAKQTLRRAATGEKVTSGEVDQAIQKVLQARTQLDALDREAVQTVVKDLTPEKRARAMLFLDRLHTRFGAGGPPGMHGGPGRGMGRGRGGGMGPGGPGGPGEMGMGPGPEMGPGMMAGACPNQDCPWNDGGPDEDD